MVTTRHKKKTVTDAKLSSDDIKENQTVRRKAKKVTFSPESENEIFEFTRSVKRPQRKNVRSRSQERIQQGRGNIQLRRSNRIMANAVTVRIGIRKECSLLDVSTKTQNVPRRSKRNGFSGRDQEERKETELSAHEQFEVNKVRRRSARLAAVSCMGSGTSNAGTLLSGKLSEGLVVDTGNKEEPELVKNNTNELSMEFEVLETRKHHRKDVHLDPKAEKVLRRSRRFVNEEPLADYEVQNVSVDGKVPRRSKRRRCSPVRL